jgi:hypothetical protein
MEGNQAHGSRPDAAAPTDQEADDLWSGLSSIVDSMTEPVTRHVARKLMARPGFAESFKRAPASRCANVSEAGSLIARAHRLCRLGEVVVEHYQQRLVTAVSRDKVMFGLLFQDAAETYEYDLDDPAFGRTPIGKLTPHAVLGPAWVYFAAGSFPNRGSFDGFAVEVAHLMHILAAHHGCPEFGSPVRPATLEAVLVHAIDAIDVQGTPSWNNVTAKPDVDGVPTSPEASPDADDESLPVEASQQNSYPHAGPGTPAIDSEATAIPRPATADHPPLVDGRASVAPDALVHESGKKVGVGSESPGVQKTDRRYPPGHPALWEVSSDCDEEEMELNREESEFWESVDFDEYLSRFEPERRREDGRIIGHDTDPTMRWDYGTEEYYNDDVDDDVLDDTPTEDIDF